MREIHVVQHFCAAPERVFATVSDHECFIHGRGVVCQLLREGEGDRNGVGAIRQVRGGGMVFDEEIVAFEPARHYAYVIRSLRLANGMRLPFRHHRGWLDFQREGDTTRLDWYSRFSVDLRILGPWVLEPLFKLRAAAAFNALLRNAQRTIAA